MDFTWGKYQSGSVLDHFVLFILNVFLCFLCFSVGIFAFEGLQKTFCPCTCPETDIHVYTQRHTNIVCAYKGC